MRTVWRGALWLGLVKVAVRLVTATEPRQVRLHLVHRADGGRIRHERVCAGCGERVDEADLARGYEYDDGRIVVLENEDLEQQPPSTDHVIDVQQFVHDGEIDPIFFRRSYYVEPDDAAVRPYVVFRETLEREHKLAVVKIALRARETLAVVRARNDVLVLHTMMWPDEIRQPSFGFLARDTEVRTTELAAASSLVGTMTRPFEPAAFTDDYRDGLLRTIEAKSASVDIPAQPGPDDSGSDLVEMLRRSVEQARTEH